MPDENGVRLWCTNDGCEVKDIRVYTAAEYARCPECGANLASNNARPQRQYRTY